VGCAIVEEKARIRRTKTTSFNYIEDVLTYLVSYADVSNQLHLSFRISPITNFPICSESVASPYGFNFDLPDRPFNTRSKDRINLSLVIFFRTPITESSPRSAKFVQFSSFLVSYWTVPGISTLFPVLQT
jgi:hypothetical protein